MFVDEYLNTYRTLKGQIEEYLATDRSYLFDSVELHTIQTYLGGLRENLDGEEIYGNYDLVSKLTNNVLDTIEWLADLGVNFREAIAMPVGAMWRRGHKPEEAKGVEFINVLGSTIEEKGGEVLLETTATKLIQENGKIIGVEAGNDPEFNKSSFDLKVEVGPFYATPRMPATHHTMGGLMINTSAEVINEEGNVIEGLFAAGEVTGGIHGGNRLGGNSLSDIFTFGRIAGKSAASKE